MKSTKSTQAKLLGSEEGGEGEGRESDGAASPDDHDVR